MSRRGRGRGRNRNYHFESDEGDIDISDLYPNNVEEVGAIMAALREMEPRKRERQTFSNEYVYTEDNIPVNTVYASFKGEYKNQADEAFVRGLFDKFGPIRGVRIHSVHKTEIPGLSSRANHKSREPQTANYAFVSFENCADAKRCLQNKRSFAGRCYINAADSWHQDAYYQKQEKESSINDPGTSSTSNGSNDQTHGAAKDQDSETKVTAETIGVINEEMDNTEEANKTSILNLNDDCLRLIFEEVRLQELLALKETCRRFEGVVFDILKRYKVLDLDLELCEKPFLTMLDAKHIFMKVGPFVEHLCISRHRFIHQGTRILTQIPRYFSNLKHLEIQDFTLSANILNKLSCVFKNLEALSLSNCGISDNIAQNLQYAKNLKRLDLSSNSELSGLCLRKIKDLKYLNLEDCQNIQGKPFSQFALNNKTLEYLNIHCCNRLTADAIKSIANNMTELSHLVCNSVYELADSSSIALIAKLPKLNNLQLKMNSFHSINQILQSFAESNQLEQLDLSDGLHTSIDYNLLCGMTKLKVLKLNYKLDFSDEYLAKLGTKGNFVELHIAGCTEITDNQLIEFIKKNPMLNVLDISYCRISEGLIFSAIDILKEQAGLKTSNLVECTSRRLKLVVGETNICPVILNNALIKSNHHLLQISFDTTEGLGLDDMDDYNFSDIIDDDDEDYEDYMGYDFDDEYDSDTFEAVWMDGVFYEMRYNFGDYDDLSDLW